MYILNVKVIRKKVQTTNTHMIQQLDFALRDGVLHYRGAERGARQCCLTSVDEKKREAVAVGLGCIAVDPESCKLVELPFTCGGDSLQ